MIDDQPRLALPWEEPNSFFRSLIPSESRGHSQENESFVQFAVFGRDLKSAAGACGLLEFPGGGEVLSVLREAFSLEREACCNCSCFAVNAAAMELRR